MQQRCEPNGKTRATTFTSATDCPRSFTPLIFAPLARRRRSRSQRAVYANEVLEPIAGLHKLGSQVTDDAEDMDGGWGTNERTTTCSLDNSARSR